MSSDSALAAALVLGLTAACSGPATSDRALPARASSADVLAAPAPAEGPEAPAADAAPPARVDSGDLDALVARAVAEHPAVVAARHRWRAALERAPQVSKLPEPTLTLGAWPSPVETRSGPMRGRLGLSQRLPWKGKLSLAEEAALKRAEAEAQRLEATVLAVERDVRAAWAELAWLRHAEELNRLQLELLSQVEAVTRSRYETGRAHHADLVRIQVELGRTEDRIAELVDAQRPARERLRSAIGGGAVLPDAPAWDAVAARAAAIAPPGDDLARLAATNPDLRALTLEADAAAVDEDRAGLERRPDFVVGADWTVVGEGPSTFADAGRDALAVTMALTLPIRGEAYDAAEHEARARRGDALSRRRALLLDLTTAWEEWSFRARDAIRRWRLYEQALVPKADEAYSVALSAYRTDEATFQDVLDAARVLLEFRLLEARAAADLVVADAELRRLAPEAPEAPADR